MKLTRGRIRALKLTLLSTHAHRYPYDDVREEIALKEAGLLDSTSRITLEGAMVVLRDVVTTPIAWLAVEETQRVLNEIKMIFPEELAGNAP